MMLLRVLFKLFKSEVCVSVSLRKGLRNFNRDRNLSQKYTKDVNALLSRAKGVIETSGLSGVVGLTKSALAGFAWSESKKNLEKARVLLESFVQKRKQGQNELVRASYQLQEFKTNNAPMKTKRRELYNEVMAEETALSKSLPRLEEEIERLRSKNSKFEREMKCGGLEESFMDVDFKIRDISGKVKILNTVHRRKVACDQEQIAKMVQENEDLVLRQSRAERDLDNMHARIDALTNPLCQGEDDRVSQADVNELVHTLESHLSQCEQGQLRIDSLKCEIRQMRDFTAELSHQLEEEESTVERMREERHQQSVFLERLGIVSREYQERAETVLELDRIKAHLEGEKYRLEREYEGVRGRARVVLMDNRALKKARLANEENLGKLDSKMRQVEEIGRNAERHSAVVDGVFGRIRESLKLSRESKIV
jgi:chromosome segregation ATPase